MFKGFQGFLALVLLAGCTSTPEVVEPAPQNVTTVTMLQCDKGPVYPMQAALKRLNGWVLLEFTLTAEGKPEQVVVVKSSPNPIFDKAALTSIATCRFKAQNPAMARQQYLLEFSMTP